MLTQWLSDALLGSGGSEELEGGPEEQAAAQKQGW